MPTSPRTAATKSGRAFANVLQRQLSKGNAESALGYIRAIEAEAAAPGLDVEALRKAIRSGIKQWVSMLDEDDSQAELWHFIAAAYARLAPTQPTDDWDPAVNGIHKQGCVLRPDHLGWCSLDNVNFGMAPPAQARPADAALRGSIGPRIGVRLRDAFWVDSRHYDHYHDHGVTVTHEVGEWCRHQLIGQNWPCPPNDNGDATQKVAQQPTAAEDA